MTNDAQLPTTATRKAKIEGQLTETKPSTLEDGEVKVAKSRAKKHGSNCDEEIFRKTVEKNGDQARALWSEFGVKMTRLGYAAQPILEVDHFGIRPSLKIRPLSSSEQSALLARMDAQSGK